MKLKVLLGDERLWPRWLRNSIWASAIFFALGYLPTLAMRQPAAGMMLASAGMIWVGSRSPRPGRAALRGLLLGLLAGLAIGGAMAQVTMGRPELVPQDRRTETLVRMLIVFGSATAALCAAVAWAFAMAARRRAKLLEQTWEKKHPGR